MPGQALKLLETGIFSVEAFTGVSLTYRDGGTGTATLRFANGALADVSARLKLGQTSLVKAIAKADGKFYIAQKECKVTVGGCGG